MLLTRQDWRGPQAGWGPESPGYWEVRVAQAGVYDVKSIFPARDQVALARFRLRDLEAAQEVPVASGECVFREVRLSPGEGRLEAWVTRGHETAGVHYVEVNRWDALP